MAPSPDSLIALAATLLAFIPLALIAHAIGRRRRWRDPQRLFTWEQKKTLLARARWRCEHKHPLWPRCRAVTGLQADHIVPWSRGGATALGNGAALCQRHNARKSNRMPSPLYRWRLRQRRRKYS
ncbi:HNH endonuclease [Nocardiopsis alborubida]|uniref:HNH endonuclease n=1 Tax=Nocardiopsis alborubida TaxID=146802 RepID=A0A7X6RNW1_9ACTN|nr:HNH endonuclease signature motif containing protein [Nocardiopsis alborubida]NKY96547.1 HNH endonuclease [Nocardiopsis alborubida]